MSESTWPELAGKELPFAGKQWELTGQVEVRDSGALLEVEARQVDDDRHPVATLRFGLDSPPASLNPGAINDHFDQLRPNGDEYHLLVKTEGRTYRYELQGVSRR